MIIISRKRSNIGKENQDLKSLVSSMVVNPETADKYNILREK